MQLAGLPPPLRSLAALGLALLVSAGCQTPAPAAAPAPEAEAGDEDVFEPAEGVSCSLLERVCSWRGGPTVGLTRLFFGDAPAEALLPAARESAYRHDPIFNAEPSGSCDTLVTTCYQAGGPDAELTARYFGDAARERLEKRMRTAGNGMERRGPEVTCDRMAGVCYDRLGAGYGATRLYLGEEPAGLLLRRLQRWRIRES